MERYQVILAYDGTNFSGSQRQAETRTVQSVLEAGLRKLNWTDPSVLLAGRTDAGVHASGQVAAFDLSWRHSPEDLQRALNAVLPKDLAVRSVTPCVADFHPRFDALSRSYRYEILCDATRNPLEERFSWRVWPAPEFDRLQAAARLLLGTFDFASFGRATSPQGSTIRKIEQASWQQKGNRLTFCITANAFLYHMVRRIVFVLVSVGQSKLEIERISQALQSPEDHPMFQGLAPSQGLYLVEVKYPPDRENKRSN